MDFLKVNIASDFGIYTATADAHALFAAQTSVKITGGSLGFSISDSYMAGINMPDKVLLIVTGCGHAVIG